MDQATQTNPHLSGNLAPIRTEDDFQLTVKGRIPQGLNGVFYRNGPNPQFEPGPGYHAFIGDGMIHAFFIDGEKGTARYRNRWVRTPRFLAEAKAGRALFGGLGRPHDPSVEGVTPGGANTNVLVHAGRLMALQEQSEPFEMDRQTLESRGFMQTGGKFTAHPKVDPETGELVWFAYSAGPDPLNRLIDFGVTDASGRVTRRDRFAAPYTSMVHDFLVTRRYALFPILPLTGSIERAQRGAPAYAWEPQKGAYVGVMARNASVDTVQWFEIEPNYVFHPMNAWEDGDLIHAEVMEYPYAPLFPNPDGTVADEPRATLARWTLDLKGSSNAVRRTPLQDLPGEFPGLDERFAGLPYRHGWYAANANDEDVLLFDSLAHVDIKTGRQVVRTFERGDSVGEPIFVPRSKDAPEGDGWVLVLRHRAADNASEMVILDAQNIAGEPVAVLGAPRRVPAGFHGNWAPA